MTACFGWPGHHPDSRKYIGDLPTDSGALEPFLLLGLLANYNKFEYRNPYRLRLEDFVNEAVIQKIISGVGQASLGLRRRYTEIIDDIPADQGWSLAAALNYIGLGMLAPIKAIALTTSAEDQKERFVHLCGPPILFNTLRLTPPDPGLKRRCFSPSMTF